MKKKDLGRCKIVCGNNPETYYLAFMPILDSFEAQGETFFIHREFTTSGPGKEYTATHGTSGGRITSDATIEKTKARALRLISENGDIQLKIKNFAEKIAAKRLVKNPYQKIRIRYA